MKTKSFILICCLSGVISSVQAEVGVPDDSKCILELKSHAPAGLDAPTDNPAFIKLLEDKGYTINLTTDQDWPGVASNPTAESLEKFNNKVFLGYDYFHCFDTSSTLSFFPKWACGVGVNTFGFAAVSNGKVYAPYTKIKDYIVGDINKSFKTKEEAKKYLLEGFNKLIPSCEQVRSKMPEVGKAKSANVKSVPVILDTLKEVQTKTTMKPLSENDNREIKNDNAVKVIDLDKVEHESVNGKAVSK